MLAARAEGVGSCLTALLQFFHPTETFEILGVPPTRAGSSPAPSASAIRPGPGASARAGPVHEVSYRNAWGSDVGFSVPEPLWPG